MQKPNGLIALLLIIAVLLSRPDSPETGFVTQSPQAVCGDCLSQNETLEDNETDRIIIAVIIVIIVIFIINCITNTGDQSSRTEVKTGWKSF